MPEMRRDPITKNWVIIATERARRPESELIDGDALAEGIAHDPACFFCTGNEYTTPPEVMAYRREESMSDKPGWSLRVVPNKYAALNMEGSFKLDNSNNNNLKVSGYAAGLAEVIIETDHHSKNIALFNNKETFAVLKSYRDRYLVLSQEDAIEYITIFRNNGKEAGATLIHPHSQILAIPIVPINVKNEIGGAKEHYDKTLNCIYCDIIENELREKRRIVCETDNFLAFAPYWSKTPFETWVAPKFHSARYETLSNLHLEELAIVWKAVLYKIYAGLDNPPYNYYIHTAPVHESPDKYYHWHMEFIPKLTMAAGFELATGMYINITIPEDCADFLRDIPVK